MEGQHRLHDLEEGVADWAKNAFAGGKAGLIVHTVVSPLERVKQLLQTQDSNRRIRSGEVARYKGVVDCFKRIVRDEGVAALWRGNLSDLYRYFPNQALSFAFKDQYKKLFNHYDPKAEFGKYFAANLAAGGAAGASALVIIYPLDVASTRVTADIGNHSTRQFRNIRDVLYNIYRKEGARGLYRGLVPTIEGIIVYRACFFGTFDTAKGLLFEDPERPPFWKNWLLSQVTTVFSAFVSYPFDTVRHQLMMQSGESHQEFSSTRDAWATIWRKEGFKGFYRGMNANVLRSAVAGTTLVLYDEIKKLMTDLTGKRQPRGLGV